MIAIFSEPSYLVPPLFVAAVTFVLLVIALLWSRRDFATILFCGVLVCMTLLNVFVYAMRSSPDVHHALVWEKAILPPTTAAFVLYYHFALVYTNTRGKRHRGLLLASYLFLILITVITPTDLLVKGMQVKDYGYAPIIGPVCYVWFLAGPLLILGGAYNLLRNYKVSNSREEKARLIYPVIAAAFPLIGSFLDGFTDLPPATIWTNLIFCILCSIAILKYNLLDIRVFVRKSSVYLLVSAVVAIPYVGLLYILYYIFQLRIAPWWLHGLLVLLIAIVLRPIYGWAQQSIDKLFYRDRYDYLKALEQFSNQAQSVVKLKELGSRMTQLVTGALRASNACLLLPSKGRNSLAVLCNIGCIGGQQSFRQMARGSRGYAFF